MAAANWPIEPPRTGWRLPDPRRLRPAEAGHDLLAVGADLSPGTVLAAYRRGLFPMHVSLPESDPSSEPDDDRITDTDDESTSQSPAAAGELPRQIGWWSPDPRGVLPLDGLRVSRSMRRARRRFRVTYDEAFEEVVAGCADRGRPDGWINSDIEAAYTQLHADGWAHSVEVRQGGELVGGLYGVAIGGLFAGESMFHRVNDASKVALMYLVEQLSCDGERRLLDVQWVTPHLASLGAVAVDRTTYLGQLDQALRLPLPPRFAHPPARHSQT
ncbi:MAG TPA: leucyl/phenylalanyl-tRNA--protein transferase [Actinomycetes bacterium]|nr:leucyl/phenylalanyl-tRNA--protein transferase [Actinomycetes bacterium]